LALYQRLDWSYFFPEADFDIGYELNSSDSEKIVKLETLISKALIQNCERSDLFVLSVANRIRELEGKLIIEDLAKSFHLSLRQLQRRFKKYRIYEYN